MPTPRLTRETAQKTVDAVNEAGGNIRDAADILGIPRGTVDSRLFTARTVYGLIPECRRTEKPYEVPQIPDDDISVDELVEQRKRQFERKREHEEFAKLIPVRVKIGGPVGILHFGDPHVDDDGTDIGLLESHAKLVRDTEGLFAANLGDTTNNWVGRLARLYGEQSTSASQAWKLAEWFIGQCPWLYMIAGNHNLWSGAGDPIKWIARSSSTLYQASECRIELKFPNGRSIRVNARHDFAGSSQYNSAHGSTKALMFGVRDHIAVAGHKHESGYNVLKDPASGITMHAIKVASYKVYDRYAKEKGFRDNTLSPCAVTVIDPALPEKHPDLIKVWWTPEEAAEYLTWKRQRK